MSKRKGPSLDRAAAEAETPDDFDLVEPRAETLVRSLRSVGYSLQAAVADLVDNSITASAREIRIHMEWNGPKSWVVIADNGHGMSEAGLIEAMRIGSVSASRDRSEGDLGRFGLGLKTASFSQAKTLTVFTWQSDKRFCVRSWDLDRIQKLNEWRLAKSASVDAAAVFNRQRSPHHGTVVVWENLDRIVGGAAVDDRSAQDRFLEQIGHVRSHLAMVFHRLLVGPGSVTLSVNDRPVVAWDPFLEGAAATQRLPEESFGGGVTVRPFVLPHHSKLTAEQHAHAAGPSGWNAQQGFYVYRERRLLVPGSWLGLRMQKEEHCKLARIQVDLTNRTDDEWAIDVKKSTASPPRLIRNDLRRIAKLTRERAVDVYRHRGKVVARRSAEPHVFAWQRMVKDGRFRYVINRKHPLVQAVLSDAGQQPRIGALLRLLEETLPVPLILIDGREQPEADAPPFDDVDAAEIKLVAMQVYDALLAVHRDPREAARQLAAIEPFAGFPGVVREVTGGSGA